MLISGGRGNYGMRRFSTRRGRSRKPSRKMVMQHIPSLMGNSPANNIGLVHVLAHSGSLAGGSPSASRMDEDRLTEVANGNHIGRMHVNVNFIPASTSEGYYEYAFVKYERSFTVPVIGVDPVPSSADITTNGLQQEVRSFTPGYVVQFGTIPITPETIVSRNLTVSWAKFGKSLVRDGDYFCLIFFNRTGAAATVYDLQIRFKTYH